MADGSARLGGRLLAGSALLGMLVGALAFFAHLATAYLSLAIEPATLEREIDAAFRSGDLPSTTFGVGYRYGVHRWLECELLAMTVHRGKEPLSQALSPLQLGVAPSGIDAPCESLREYLAAAPEARRAWRSFKRHHYLNGLRTFAAFGIGLFGLAGLRELLRWSTYLLVAGIVVASAGRILYHLRRSGNREPAAMAIASTESARLVLTLAFVVFGGVPLHVWTIGHGVPYLALLGLLLLSALVNFNEMRTLSLALLGAALGALAAHVDYFMGATALLLAALVAVLAIQMHPARPPAEKTQRVVTAGLAFMASLTACFASKLAIASWRFGPVVWGVLTSRFRAQAGFERYLLAQTVGSISGAAPSLALGSASVGRAVLVAGPPLAVLLFAGATRRARDPGQRVALFWLGASGLIVPVWYAVFWDHAVQHAYFMINLLGWFLAAGLAAPFLTLRGRR